MIRYYLDAPIWVPPGPDGETPYWRARDGVVGMIDLRPLPTQALAGKYGDRPWLFVATNKPLDSSAISLGIGDLREVKTASLMASAWASAMGYRPEGDRLIDFLVSQLTKGSDPTGEEGPAPLMPTLSLNMEILLGGHGRAWRDVFAWGGPYTPKVRDRLHHAFRVMRAQDIAQAGALRALARQITPSWPATLSKTTAAIEKNRELLASWRAKGQSTQQAVALLHWHAASVDERERRRLDWLWEQYGLANWRELVPPELQADHPGPLPHQTSFTESWPTNSTTISSGQDQPWTEVLNDSEVSGGLLRGVTGNTVKRNRCETVLSSVDHSCQATITHNSAGSTSRNNEVSIRFDSAADTSYQYRIAGLDGGESIQKCVTGTFTSLTSGARTNSLDTIYLEANGSSLQAKYAGANSLSVTDTSITTGVRVGAGGNGSGVTWGLDSIVAADLAADDDSSSSSSSSLSSSSSSSLSSSSSSSLSSTSSSSSSSLSSSSSSSSSSLSSTSSSSSSSLSSSSSSSPSSTSSSSSSSLSSSSSSSSSSLSSQSDESSQSSSSSSSSSLSSSSSSSLSSSSSSSPSSQSSSSSTSSSSSSSLSSSSSSSLSSSSSFSSTSSSSSSSLSSQSSSSSSSVSSSSSSSSQSESTSSSSSSSVAAQIYFPKYAAFQYVS